MAERTEGEAVKALEAAAEALAERWPLLDRGTRPDGRTPFDAVASEAVAAWLDSLLGDIPEEARSAAWTAFDVPDNATLVEERAAFRNSLTAFLRSLRSSLDGS